MNPTTSPRRLRLSDVRKVFRLIGEVRELGADPKSWRPHMVKHLCALLGADLVVSSEVHALTTSTPGVVKVVDIGWGCDSDGSDWAIHSERDNESLESWRLAAGEIPHEAPDATSIPVRPLKPVYGGTSFVLSQYSLPHINSVDQLGLHRAFGAPSFSAVEHKLIRLFHVELGRLWRKDALSRAKDPGHDLPPRLSQTLDQLLAGKSEKEIAAKLDLSRHTIHNYVKALHQRFEVSSRGELLAKAGAARKPDFVPKLTVMVTGRKEEARRHEGT